MGKTQEELDLEKELKAEQMVEWGRDIDIMLDDHEYHWISEQNTWAKKYKNGDVSFRRDQALKIRHIELRNKEFYALWDAELTKRGWKHDSVIYTFEESKISANMSIGKDTLNLLTKDHWVKPIYDGDPHWIFDFLMHSLGGGKTENVEHIKKVILSKYQHPENYMLPCLVIYGESGGVGKNLFVERLLATIFGDYQVSKLAVEDVVGKFNSCIAGKTIVFIDEAVQEKVDENKLKSMLHSSTIQIERKFVDQFSSDNTPLYIIAGNNSSGSVRLSGEDTDRRFSIIYADTPLKEITKVMLDTTGEIKDCTEDQAYNWCKDVGQHILCNDEEVGKWLGSLIETFGDVKNMSALHGEDYQELLNERQETVQAELCKEVFIERNVDYIKALTLYEMYKLWVKRDNPATKPLKKANFYAFVTRWLVKNTTDYNVHIQVAQWIRHTQQSSAKVIKKQNLGTQLKNNDDDFIEKDDKNNVSLIEW